MIIGIILLILGIILIIASYEDMDDEIGGVGFLMLIIGILICSIAENKKQNSVEYKNEQLREAIHHINEESKERKEAIKLYNETKMLEDSLKKLKKSGY